VRTKLLTWCHWWCRSCTGHQGDLFGCRYRF